MKKIYKLKSFVLATFILLNTFMINGQDKPKQSGVESIKAEKDYFAQFVDPAKFFNLEVVTHCQLSSDGKRYAYIVSSGDEHKLFIKKVTAGEPVLLAKFQSNAVEGLRWISNGNLVYKMTEFGQYEPNLFLLNADNPKGAQPLAKPGQKVDWLNVVYPNDDHFCYAIDQNFSNSLELMKYDFKSEKSDLIMENPGHVLQWFVNNIGEPAAAITCSEFSRKLVALRKSSKINEELSINIELADELLPLSVSSDNKKLICLSDINRENTALVAIDLESMKEIEELFAPSNADVSECVFSNMGTTAVGAFYGPGFSSTEIWDASFKKVFTSAKQKLNKEDQVKVVSTNESNSLLILKVTNPKYPTEFYLYNVASGILQVVNRPIIRESEEKTIYTKSIDIKSTDGYMLKGFVTTPPTAQKVTGMVVLVQEHPFDRVSHEYNPLVNYFCANGLIVLQIDHVGVSGYGKKHRSSGYGELDGKMIDDLADGVQYCISQRIYGGKKVAVVGSGYGGHAAMLCMLKYSDVFSAYVCESGIMTIGNYTERLTDGTSNCNKKHFNKMYVNNSIKSCGDLTSAFHGMELTHGLDERLLMVYSPESLLFDASEASNLASICEQKNVGVEAITISSTSSPDNKTMSRIEYYKKMISVIKLGLSASNSEK